MQRHGLGQYICAVLAASIPLLNSCGTVTTDRPYPGYGHGTTTIDNSTAIYFSNELGEFRAYLAPHIEQLDGCLKDIDRLEKSLNNDKLRLMVSGIPDCEKYDQQRIAVDAKVEQITLELESYRRLWTAPRDYYGNNDWALIEISAQADEVESLLWIRKSQLWLYQIKTKQVRASLSRVKAKEEQVERQLEVLRNPRSNASQLPQSTN